ncbi:sporulation integral membrane protein YtvI [Clostridium sp. MSJ-11]|uniref:Sporulation integral membrane protein YtvI n=1 Tax=Clostridium mobile TaxID=2841512 RepID=A0ABS6EMD4_9CLOT|nr:sporulation integral membrane protein YtvI [Clostridium mobile]MBU5486389.1 sporulation integral membrane protein YtvI [Clostridium mobile]
MDNLIEKFDKYILFFIIYTLTFILFFKTLKYTLPFFLAFIFSLILKKPTELLIKKLKLKKGFAALITTLLFFALILFCISLIATSFTREAIQLGKNTQNYISNNSANINNFFNNLADYYKNLDPSIIATVESNFASFVSKLSNITVSITSKIIQATVSFLTYIPYLFMLILFTLLSTYFFTKDFSLAKNKLMSTIIPEKSDRIYDILKQSRKMLLNYALSYLLVINITFLETLVGFSFLRINYALILSIIAAIFDILPILGIGGIYIPLSLIYIFIYKNYFIGIGILIWYVVVTVVRQILEPKIVSSSLGIHPVSVLASIFIGLKIAGFKGMVFCMFMVVTFKILKQTKVL